jgi:mono/diheme cytochrome c family protein
MSRQNEHRLLSLRPASRILMRSAALVAGLLFAAAAPAQDAERGRVLYQTHCGGCHYERVHQRLRSEIRDLADLRDMVARWAPQARRTYTLDELEDIVQYLNESHYRFGLGARAPRKAPK